jgi:pyruvate/2-oxoglutarate dehydrogenase complex dihydrolipoamide dehydrogenase (E3) component
MQSLKRRAHAKVIAHAKSGSVLGLHYYALNSGEAMQGFSVAFATGHLTLDILLNRALGIHPVNAEELVNLTVAKPGNPERLGC